MSSLTDCKSAHFQTVTACQIRAGQFLTSDGKEVGTFTVEGTTGQSVAVGPGDTLQFESDTLDINVQPGSAKVIINQAAGPFIIRGGLSESDFYNAGDARWYTFSATSTSISDTINTALAPLPESDTPEGIGHLTVPFPLTKVTIVGSISYFGTPEVYDRILVRVFDKQYLPLSDIVEYKFDSTPVGQPRSFMFTVPLSTPLPAVTPFYVGFQQGPTGASWTYVIHVYA
uniref:Uncharacterized protein n=1 Tax=viral metagenome TaxID=1070528 RepID=A0A6C0BPA7_9ZZZZ